MKRTQNTRAADRLLYLSRLPDPSRGHFKSLCSLAFKGLEEDKLVFSSDEVEKIFPAEYQELDMDLPVLDLMTSAKSYISRGPQVTYSFLHLTIQEFLAAYWLSFIADIRKLHYFHKYIMDNRFRMVLLFLSGLTKLSFPGAHSVFSQESWIKDSNLVCHLLYESGNHSVCTHLSESGILSKTIKLSGSTFDALVVSHFVAYSGYQWDLLEMRAEDVKIVHRLFSTCTLQNVNTSVKDILIKFCTAHVTDTSVHTSSTGDIVWSGVEKSTRTILNELNMDLTTLRLLDKLPQITRVIVSLKIDEVDFQSCQTLMNSLSVALVGPCAVHKKYYTIVVDFLGGEPQSYIDELPASSKAKFVKHWLNVLLKTVV